MPQLAHPQWWAGRAAHRLPCSAQARWAGPLPPCFDTVPSSHSPRHLSLQLPGGARRHAAAAPCWPPGATAATPPHTPARSPSRHAVRTGCSLPAALLPRRAPNRPLAAHGPRAPSPSLARRLAASPACPSAGGSCSRPHSLSAHSLSGSPELRRQLLAAPRPLRSQPLQLARAQAAAARGPTASSLTASPACPSAGGSCRASAPRSSWACP
jgi:hypothetical protein